jgi:hypothetical protein
MIRLLNRYQDSLRYSLRFRCALAQLYACAGLLSPTLTIRCLLTSRALEFTDNAGLRDRLVARLNAWGAFEKSDIWLDLARKSPRYQSQFRHKMTLGRSIVLKAPGENGEKGALLLTFEYNWARLFLGLDPAGLAWINENFNLVLSTSWSPTDYAMLALALSCVPGRLFVQSCNYEECAFIEALHPRLCCLKTLPCDWIDPTGFQAKSPDKRSIDLLMVANFGQFKRHWEFFEMLSQMPKSLKVVLVGQRSGGRNKAFIERMAREHGVKQQITVYESLDIKDVVTIQSDSKVSIIMTRREGCCVAAVESMMAGCALAMREDAHVGPKAYINNRTGRQLRPGHLVEDLQRLLDDAHNMDPRAWCLENTCNTLSHLRLNDQLRSYETKEGRLWTKDIITPRWYPHPTFAKVEEQEAMKPIYDKLHQRYPNVFAADLRMESWR